MGACATKPLDSAHKKVPVEIHEETFTPRLAEAPPTTVETVTTAEKVEKPSDAVEEKNDEEKPVDASTDSKPSDAIEEKNDEEKPVDASETKPTSPQEEQKFDTIEKAPEKTPSKEKEVVEHEEVKAASNEIKG